MMATEAKKRTGKKRRSQANVRAASKPDNALHVRLTLMVVTLAILVSVLLVRRSTADDAELAPDVLGLWTTSDPRYGDRAFRITNDSLTLNLGEGTGTVTYPIAHVSRRRLDQATSYVLEYTDPTDGVSYKLPFVQKDGGIIQIDNQDGVEWTQGGTAVIRSLGDQTANERVRSQVSPLSDLMIVCIKDATSRGQAGSTVRCVPRDST